MSDQSPIAPSDSSAPSDPTSNDQVQPLQSLPNGTSTSTNAEAGPSTPRPTSTSNGDDIVMNGTSPRKDAAEPEKDKEDGDDEKDQVPDVSQLFAARREEELARRDRSLAEFLVMLDGYKPLMPEEVTEYYLQRAGFECSDPRLKRLLSLSAQKFISDLSRDAFHFAKLRVNGTAVGRGRPAAGAERNRVVLTMDDLSLALGEHGVNVKKPDYYL